MSGTWDKRTYPVTFQLRTNSNSYKVELYDSSNNWTLPLAQLSFAYRDSTSSPQGNYVYCHTLSLLPGNYEYKHKINQTSWVLNPEKQTRNNNNFLSKDDFIQLVVERCDSLEREPAAVTNGNDSKNINIHYCDVGMSLFKKPLFWDTEITVNETQHYKAHRAILSVHSGYFAALFDMYGKLVTDLSFLKKYSLPHLYQIELDELYQMV